MTPIPLKKLTMAEIVGKDLLKAPGTNIHKQLAVIYGTVSSAAVKPSKFDENQKILLGRFEARNVITGQEYTSERLYLPDRDYQESLARACAPNPETGEVNEPEFGFVIGIRDHAKSPTGYTFTCEPFTDVKAQDRLDRVRKLVKDTDILKRFNLPALAAPEDDKPKSNAKK